MTFSNNQAYGLASIAVILLTIYVDSNILRQDNLPVERKLEQRVNASQANELASPSKQTMLQTVKPEQPMAELVFATIALPSPPAAKPQAAKPQTQTALATLHRSSNSVESDRDRNSNRNKTTVNNNTQDLASENAYIRQNTELVSTEKAIQNQYMHLSSLNSGGLQLAFPNSIKESQQILRFMHQCIGITVGAYNPKEQKENRLTILSHKQNKRDKQQTNQGLSKIMRLVTGIQTPKESALINAYAPNQQLARLYPIWFDYALSEYIASYIENEPLTQFSGVYQLQGNTILLTKIKLNNKHIAQDWALAEKRVCGA